MQSGNNECQSRETDKTRQNKPHRHEDQFGPIKEGR
jgi:hypothetical protein